MVIEEVRALVNKSEEISKEISTVEEQLDKEKKKHVDFWEKLRKKCESEGHDFKQVEAEKEELRRLREKVRNALWPERSLTPEERTRMLKLGLKYEMREESYLCPYCRKVIRSVFPRRWSVSIHYKGYFSYWLNLNENDWPEEKHEMLRQIKQEVEEFFNKVESLETRLEVLKKEREEIRKQIHAIWKLCDSALGISESTRKSYEARISQIEYAHRPPPPFGDPDAFRD